MQYSLIFYNEPFVEGITFLFLGSISKHPIIKRKKFESYFVHSYNFVCENKKNILATCEYQQKITAIVGKENIIGTQFHPEKSQEIGLEILKNFISWKY